MLLDICICIIKHFLLKLLPSDVKTTPRFIIFLLGMLGWIDMTIHLSVRYKSFQNNFDTTLCMCSPCKQIKNKWCRNYLRNICMYCLNAARLLYADVKSSCAAFNNIIIETCLTIWTPMLTPSTKDSIQAIRLNGT